MADVYDVAQYILMQRGPMSAMKLQKLVYYAQVWSVVWEDEPLFPETIEAWKMGPVVRDLYNEHRGQFKVTEIDSGAPDELTGVEQETIDLVLGFYGDKSAQWLSDLTHLEDPWKNAWAAEANSQGVKEITLEAIAEYYTSLEPTGAEA